MVNIKIRYTNCIIKTIYYKIQKMIQMLTTIIENSNLFLNNTFFYLFILSVVISGVILFLIIRKLLKKNQEIEIIQKQHIGKLDKLREDHSIHVQNLHKEMLKKEEERTRQWVESEKETLHVLNGVSSLLELSESIEHVESEKIIEKLEEIKTIIINKKMNNHG